MILLIVIIIIIWYGNKVFRFLIYNRKGNVLLRHYMMKILDFGAHRNEYR